MLLFISDNEILDWRDGSHKILILILIVKTFKFAIKMDPLNVFWIQFFILLVCLIVDLACIVCSIYIQL